MAVPRVQIGNIATIGVGLLFIYDFPPELFAWLWESVRGLPQARINIAESDERRAQQIIGGFLVVSSAASWAVKQWLRPGMAAKTHSPQTETSNAPTPATPSERRHALVAGLGLLCVFGYWAYTSFWSGEALLKTELRELRDTDQPTVTPLLTEAMPKQYWAGPIPLDPGANPLRVVLSVTVRRSRERVDYRVALVDQSGNVVWQEKDTIVHSATQQDKRQNTLSAQRRKNISQASGVFTIERAGNYTLLADVDRVDEPVISMRSGVIKANPLIYAMFGSLALYGAFALWRSNQQRKRMHPTG